MTREEIREKCAAISARLERERQDTLVVDLICDPAGWKMTPVIVAGDLDALGGLKKGDE